MSVVVIGGTGATGKQLVRALVSAPVSFKFTTDCISSQILSISDRLARSTKEHHRLFACMTMFAALHLRSSRLEVVCVCVCERERESECLVCVCVIV